MKLQQLSRQWLLIVVIVAVASVAHSQEGDPVKALYQDAENFSKEDKHEQALPLYRKLIFGRTKYASKSKKGLKKTLQSLVEQYLKTFEEKKESDTDAAIEALAAAYRTDQDHKAVKSTFKDLGYEYYLGEYYPKAEIEKIKADDKNRGESRRSELKLTSSYTIIRGGPFRFFHNISGGRSKIDLMTTTVKTHYLEYLTVMDALGLRYPSEGIDVVFCGSEADYLTLTDAPDTVGIYDPQTGASYFYLTGQGDDFNTLMHEMTHQLNDKVLQMGVLPACLEEGIAEYFGAGRLSASNQKVKLGSANYQSANVKDAIFNRNGATYIPFARFAVAPSPEGDSFYPQSWGLGQFLMEGHPHGRLILFDALMTCKEMRIADDYSQLDFSKILERHGTTISEFEKQYLAYFGKK